MATPQQLSSGFNADHFALLGLPRQFQLDREQLDRNWREAQAKVHPDRHAGASEAEKRVVLQWASRVNEAYRVLRSPLQRARYLCELAGHDLQAENNTAMAPAFLMQQMELREELDAAKTDKSGTQLPAMAARLDEVSRQMSAELGSLLDRDVVDYAAAVSRVREWMFIERLIEEVDAAQY